MIEIIEKDRCTGCAACLNSCSHQAITLKRDEEGFDYPFINQNKCIDCGLCVAVCPVIHYDEQQLKRTAYNGAQKVFAAKTTNEEFRRISSSGGIFPVIAQYILAKGGRVVGAAFDENFNVFHKMVTTAEGLIDIQSSKYSQSTIGLLYKEVKRELLAGRKILFAGMACQVEGLKCFLRKDYSNLYTIDLICMGIPSPGVWRKYLDSLFVGEKIWHINFKDKTDGWRAFSMRIETDKRTFLQNGFDNFFFQCMFKTYSLRPSCFNCPFKRAERLSDFTLADCWGTVNEMPHLDDNKGLSAVIVHSDKGLQLWNLLSDSLEVEEVTLESIVKNNDNIVKHKQSRCDRKKFYTLLNVFPKKAFKKYGFNPNKTTSKRIRSILAKIKNLLFR